MRGLVLIVVLALTATASASQPQAGPASREPTLAEIRADQARLADDVKAGRGVFKDMPESGRQALFAMQKTVAELIDGIDRIEQLDVEPRVQLHNELKRIQGVVADREDEAQVCERSRVVGSNRFQVTCMSAGDRRRIRERTQRGLEQAQSCNASRAECIGG